MGRGPGEVCSLSAAARELRGECCLSAGCRSDSASWKLLRNSQCSCLLAKGNPAACPPSQPPLPTLGDDPSPRSLIPHWGDHLCSLGIEEEAGPSRGEVEAQRDPEAGGGPFWGELGESMCSSEWPDILLKKEAGPGNPQLSTSSCHPGQPRPSIVCTGRAATALPQPAAAAGTGAQQDCVLGEGGGQSSLRPTVRMAYGVSLFVLCWLL